MGFASYDDLIAEMTAGKSLRLPWHYTHSSAPVAASWYHLWPVGGRPGPGALYTGTALNFQRTNDTSPGSLYHGGAKAPDTKHLVAAMAMASAGATPPTLMLVDQVGYYPLTQAATSQTFVNTTGPDRHVAAGESGLQVSLVNGALGGATASNITALNYVDQDGNAGTMPTNPVVATTANAALPSTTLGSRVLTSVAGPFLPLAAGDVGVRSLTNVTFSAANTGLQAFVLCKPLLEIPCPAAGTASLMDLVMQLASLERIVDGACLTWLVYFPVATAASITGSLSVAWG